jgi:hypothetical protein
MDYKNNMSRDRENGRENGWSPLLLMVRNILIISKFVPTGRAWNSLVWAPSVSLIDIIPNLSSAHKLLR